MKKLLFVLYFLLLSSPAFGGPLETSFNPYIPNNLNFGNTQAEVIAKIGEEPDSYRYTGYNKTKCFFRYNRQSVFNLPDEYKDMSIRYMFINGDLVAISTSISIQGNGSDHLTYFYEISKEIEIYLQQCYGNPKVFVRNAPGAPNNEQMIMVWEFDNNAISYIADPRVQICIIIISPLNESGQYEGVFENTPIQLSWILFWGMLSVL